MKLHHKEPAGGKASWAWLAWGVGEGEGKAGVKQIGAKGGWRKGGPVTRLTQGKGW